MRYKLLIAWALVNLYSSHFAGDKGYFLAQQVCELLILILVAYISPKDNYRILVSGLIFLSIGELVQELQKLNLTPFHMDYINLIFAGIGVLYYIKKRERTNSQSNKDDRP